MTSKRSNLVDDARENVAETIAARNHYTVARDSAGYAITVHRRGHADFVEHYATMGEVNRARQRLSAAGLVGYVIGSL